MVKAKKIFTYFLIMTIAVLVVVGFSRRILKNRQISNALPMFVENTKEIKTLAKLASFVLTGEEEKSFLILFQNNWEIRPGGGYIGSFGILKIQNGKIKEMQIHDLSNFDARISDGIIPPYPMQETLRIKSWKMRDSNYSPDWTANAKKAEEFYYLGKGEEKFDGIIGITANVLTSILEMTGPVEIEGYPGSFDGQGAILALETQVEKDYAEQGINKGDRKLIMNDLAKVIMNKISDFDAEQKIELAKILISDLEKKDIQFFFHDGNMQESVEAANWAGKVDLDWQDDYLFLVDSNLGAYKSDRVVERTIDYTVDFSQEKPMAKLEIGYNHTAEKKDWLTNDYTTFLRVYSQDGSWLTEKTNLGEAKFYSELNKKAFGFLIKVPVKNSKTVEMEYRLPENVIGENYKLKIQKQPGLNGVAYNLHYIGKNGEQKDKSLVLNKDEVVSFE